MSVDINHFDSIKIGLASSKQIRAWSSGEVTKPETINYRTLKPERDGLFCEKIFGPTKDWECYCGKYKRVRYKGIICERCGVEVTRQKVRRERMGHIDLAAPVSHIWFFKGVPSRIGYLLDIAPKDLEKVLYFAASICSWLDADKRAADLLDIEAKVNAEVDELRSMRDTEEAEYLLHMERRDHYLRTGEPKAFDDEDEMWRSNDERIQEERIAWRIAQLKPITELYEDTLARAVDKKLEDEHKIRPLVEGVAVEHDLDEDTHQALLEQVAELRIVNAETLAAVQELSDYTESAVTRLTEAWELFKQIQPKDLVADESLARELKDRFGSPEGFGVYLRCGMGAERVRDLLEQVDLQALEDELREKIRTKKGPQQQKAIKRLKVVSAFRLSDNSPGWMVLEAVPIIPPELRPMVQLDGGRFATSDLNDLYRRVLNRNNRLKRLLDLGAPEIIVNNEKRMLQEAVDALFDNGRRGRAVTGPGNRPLKSLSDMLKGKQGRFRQNLLGKRVDYSGRSVIVAGPELKLDQCGLPKLMALELFKPFIMSRLVSETRASNMRNAKKLVDSMPPQIWDILETVIKDHPVLLNRAPTLHRLGIQAFMPKLVEGKAIQLHPLVCKAFNADFDGDQMAVHLPLSVEAQAEARILMLSRNNILSPANGEPLATPSQDMVLGIYVLTHSKTEVSGLSGAEMAKLSPRPRAYDSANAAQLALDNEPDLALDTVAQLRVVASDGSRHRVVTTVGRIIFNGEVHGAFGVTLGDAVAGGRYINDTLTKRGLTKYIVRLVDEHGAEAIADVLDVIKAVGFKYATKAGITISKNDVVIPPAKAEILARYEQLVRRAERDYDRGIVSDRERYQVVVDLWERATQEVADATRDNLRELNPISMMANSGARGSYQQIRQLAGMRGLMSSPKGDIIEKPIKANFMEGLSVLEYFISTHGARKGLADTALRTADSGYLTRRLVDVSQDLIVRHDDCGTDHYVAARYVPHGDRLPELLESATGTLNGPGEPNDNLLGRYLARPVVDRNGEVIVDAFTMVTRDIAITGATEALEAVRARWYDAKGRLTVKGIRAHLAELWETTQAQEARGEYVPTTLRQARELALPQIDALIERRNTARGGKADILDPTAPASPEVSLVETDLVRRLNVALIEAVLPLPVRSVLKCESEVGVCATCYGRFMATGNRIEIGDAIGIIAAQSIGEPGTQLTMRTFHTGGVAGGDIADITQGLPRVVELFEARKPKGEAKLSDISGIVTVEQTERTERVVVTNEDSGEAEAYPIARGDRRIVEDGAFIRQGEAITDGPLSPARVLETRGVDAVGQYLIGEVQRVYKNQGVDINDKHIEVIARQMLKKVRIDKPGDSALLPGQLVDQSVLRRELRAAEEAGLEPPEYEQVILGITKASLATESFLSAASFQETTKVLTDAAIEGREDKLLGLKENVIIGKLIPAATGLRRYRDLEVEPAVPWDPFVQAQRYIEKQTAGTEAVADHEDWSM